MTYSIIGTGNIAWFLAKRLTSAGHQCMGIYGRNAEEAAALADSINANVYDSVKSIRDGETDICFMAVSDDAIGYLALQLSFKNTVLVHTAGSVSIDAIGAGAQDYGVLWPIYSILKNSLPSHRNIPCAWEASSDKARRYIQTMAHSFTDELIEAKSTQREWLHLSAVISNNFTNHLMAICEKICAEHNLPFDALHPIIEQTFKRVKNESPISIQTGPARRHDDATIDKQKQLLSGHWEWADIYKAITTSIKNMYVLKENAI